LCDLGPVIILICASVSLSFNENNNHHIMELL
jgi:hypothetical protein